MLIDTNNIPNNIMGANSAYEAIKKQFEAMAALISTGDIKDMDDCGAYVWSVINEATETLGE